MATSNKVKELLGVIKQAPEASVALPASEPAPAARPARRKATAKPQRAPVVASKAGKVSPIYLYPEDKQLIRELAAELAKEGLRVNDSLVIRTALRTARSGPDLIAAYHEAAQIDQRLKAQRDAARAS
jgi:hypothetical protein